MINLNLVTVIFPDGFGGILEAAEDRGFVDTSGQDDDPRRTDFGDALEEAALDYLAAMNVIVYDIDEEPVRRN